MAKVTSRRQGGVLTIEQPVNMVATSGIYKAFSQVAILIAFLSFAPIGQAQIAFVSERDWNLEIYVMDADGSNLRNLTNNPARDSSPAWSPDGQKIAFVAYDKDGNDKKEVGGEIYVMDADGNNLLRLTDNPADSSSPTWSPDGQRIAFQSSQDGGKNSEIYAMDADGDDPRNLTNNPASDSSPAWSPDGQKIAFVSDRDGDEKSGEIYVMDADGNNLLRLTDNPAGGSSPAWSPDSQKIAFQSGQEGGKSFDIHVMDADGDNPRNVTNHHASDESPSWSPDGLSIAFASGRDGNLEIYVVDADGNNPRNLTNHPAPDYQPDWLNFAGHPVSPAGMLIATWGRLKQNGE